MPGLSEPFSLSRMASEGGQCTCCWGVCVEVVIGQACEQGGLLFEAFGSKLRNKLRNDI